MVNAVAYGRVSTNKDEQLDSLEAQHKFFEEYAVKNGYNLIEIYADEGKTGTRMKNRTQLIRLLSDANRRLFEVVLIKDISRLARNVVDFLTSIRQLKSLGIRVIFVNYDQTSSDSSEFMLTMLSAIAQEESYNTSKRIKFGKKINAERGRVPNLVFGYDKSPGDYFTLSVNEKEAWTVKEIFDMYTSGNMGANKIAQELNFRGIRTKRGSAWSQIAVSRILSNELYTGRVINGKEEVQDFLTGERIILDKDCWLICEKPELRLISDDVFYRARDITKERGDIFKRTGERSSGRNTFSKLIRCESCGALFRRCERRYKNVYVKWVCSTRNSKGIHSCCNNIVIDEEVLLEKIKLYFIDTLKQRPNILKEIEKEVHREYKNKNINILSEKELKDALAKVQKSKEKYMEMYEADIISLKELKAYTKDQNNEIERLTERIKILKADNNSEALKETLKETLKNIDNILSVKDINNEMLCKIIDKIDVSMEGEVNIYFKI